MRRVLVSMVASLLLTLALFVPAASAHYPGCSYFGQVMTGDFAPHGALGELVSTYAPTGPGVISGIVASEHATCVRP